MLGAEEITIQIDRRAFTLRPTLRAAIRLHQLYGGFDKLIEAIEGDNVTAIATVMHESACRQTSIPDLIGEMVDMHLDNVCIPQTKAALIAHVLALAGHTGEEIEVSPDAKPVPFVDHHKRLFALATGWLGWTPEVAYEASPVEIIEAYKGRVDLVSTVLKAVFGEPTKEPEAEQSAEVFNDKLSAALAFASARFNNQQKETKL